MSRFDVVDYFKDPVNGEPRDVKYAQDMTDVILENAQVTVERTNRLMDEFYYANPHAAPRRINSGWRPKTVNDATPGAAKNSKHLTALACDVSDGDEALDKWLDENPSILEQCGLWREASKDTRGWCHVQIVQYASWQPGMPRTFNAR